MTRLERKGGLVLPRLGSRSGKQSDRSVNAGPSCKSIIVVDLKVDDRIDRHFHSINDLLFKASYLRIVKR